jgi:hypothetical protein
MGKLLPMQRITLIGVEYADSVVEKPSNPLFSVENEGETLAECHSLDEWLPNTWISICSIRSTASRHIADELPCMALVFTGVHVNIGARASPAVSTRQNRAGSVFTNSEWQFCQGWLS